MHVFFATQRAIESRNLPTMQRHKYFSSSTVNLLFSFTFFEVRIHVFNNLAPNITPHTRKIALRSLPRKQPYSTNLKQRHNRLRKLQAPISALQPAVIAPRSGALVSRFDAEYGSKWSPAGCRATIELLTHSALFLHLFLNDTTTSAKGQR